MKKILIFCLGITALTFPSCTVDRSEKVSPGSDRFTLKLSVDRIDTGVQTETRASVPSTGGEDNVASLYLLFFDAVSNGSGAYAGMMEYTDHPQMNMTISMGDAGLSHDKDYTILALANIERFIGNSTVDSYLSHFALMNESQAADRATFQLSGVGRDEGDDSKQIVPNQLAMAGKTTKNAGQNEVTPNLTRAVSRFDVQNTRSTQYDMVSVSIWNGMEQSTVWGTGLSSGNGGFTERFYGLKRSVPASGELEDIEGGLYSFENFQSSPAQNDKVTTCLIIGLIPKAGAPQGTPGKTMYYRVNIHPESSSQNLKRNYVYKVSIRNVTQAGAEDEYTAWSGSSTGLEVSINNWNLDEEGMILTDGTNTMVVPVKRVRLDPLGDAREYSVFTMGTGTLTISKSQLPAGITASLQGNLLKVNATALPQTETERRGSIELSFAGLRGTIDFIQSYNEHVYLTLSKSSLPSFAAIGSTPNDFQVSSSGPWKALIYNMSSGENPGFTFPRGADPVTEITGDNGDVITIYTTGTNPGNETRYSFVVVSLISDEEINRAVVLAQRPVSILRLDPQDTEITFGPLGEPRGIVNAVPGNAFTFTVDPGSDEGVMNQWEAELTGSDARYFELKKTSLGFEQKIEITAQGTSDGFPHQNHEGRTLNTTLRVWLSGAAGSGQTEVNVTITQDPVGLNYRNIGRSTVPVTGVVWNESKDRITGDYMEFEIETFEGARWKATIVGQGISSHGAFLVDENGRKVSRLDNMSATDRLRVGFDKIYYPMVQQTPTAQVKVEIVTSSNLNTIINVSQDALLGRNLNVLDVMNDNDPYGSITHGTGHFIKYFATYLKNARMFGTNGYVKTRTGVSLQGYGRSSYPYDANRKIPGMGVDGQGDQNGFAYIHMGGREGQFTNSHFISVDEWRRETDAVLVWPHDVNTTVAFNNPNTVFYQAGYGYKHPDKDGYNANTLNPDLSVKIMSYLLKDGPFTSGTPINYQGITFYNDSTCSGVNENQLPDGAVSVMNHTKGNNASILVIDPKNRLVYIGDGQLFHSDGNISEAGSRYTESVPPSSDKDKFLGNLLAYIVNAAQYGSHFTDIFIDDTVAYPFPED